MTNWEEGAAERGRCCWRSRRAEKGRRCDRPRENNEQGWCCGENSCCEKMMELQIGRRWWSLNLRSSSDSKRTRADGVDLPRRNGDEGDVELWRRWCSLRRKMLAVIEELDRCSSENRRDEVMMLKLSWWCCWLMIEKNRGRDVDDRDYEWGADVGEAERWRWWWCWLTMARRNGVAETMVLTIERDKRR